MSVFNAVVAFAQTVLMYLQWRAMVPPADGQQAGAASVVSTYWPLMAMFVLAIASWLPQFLQWKNQRPRIWGLVMPTTGTTRDAYHCVLNGASLREFKDKFNVAVVTGNNSATVDKFEDTSISVSPPFTIEAADINVEVPWSPATLAARERQIAAMKERVKAEHPEILPGTPIFIPIEHSTWQEVILLPKGVASTDIRRLSDIGRYGGKVLTRELADGRIEARP